MAKILIGNIKTPLANNLTTTDAGAAALDAAQGKVLDDKIAKNAGDVAQLNSNKLQTLIPNQSIYFGTTEITTDDTGTAHVKHAKLVGNNFMAICIPDNPRTADGCIVTNPSSDGFDVTPIKDDVSLKGKNVWIRYVAISNYY